MALLSLIELSAPFPLLVSTFIVSHSEEISHDNVI